MADSFLHFEKVLTTSNQDILVCGSGKTQIAKSLSLGNSSGSAVIANLVFYSSTTATDFEVGPISIPANSVVPWPGQFNLVPGDKIKARAATGAVITFYGPYVETDSNTPVATGITFRGVYSGGTTYAANDSVTSAGLPYVSRVSNNTGNTPASSPTQWQLLIDTASLGLVVNSRQVLTAGLATGGGALTGDVTVTVPAAVAADVLTATSTTKAVTPKSLADSLAWQALTDASTVAWDTATLGMSGRVTLGGNRTIGAPTNLIDGEIYAICLVQDGTGSRTVSWNAIWDWGTGTVITLPTAAGKRAIVVAVYENSKLRILSSWKEA